MSSPPALPPRNPPHVSPYPGADGLLPTSDPRTSSTQSLVPSEAPLTRRKLLVIYIHGFYGNDQSFKSFPAHVHALLRELLVDTHVIHSKLYPRYKTYKAIELARDNFSAWLEPHEEDGTDVVLVGHSMGGLLAGEVVLMPNKSPYKKQPFKHRILGTVAMDSPLLGLHPGLVVSGIASLFQPSPKPEDQQHNYQLPQMEHKHPETPSGLQSSSSFERLPSIDSQNDSIDTELSPDPKHQPSDPHYDPPYYNDAPFREKPFVKRLINFTSKHSREGLLGAMGKHISSHLEFGGCLADYRGLNLRYGQLRALEDVDEVKVIAEGHPVGAYARVRFVNYYTLSPGRPKPLKVDDGQSQVSQAAHDLTELHLEANVCDTNGSPVMADGEMSVGPGQQTEATAVPRGGIASQSADPAEANIVSNLQHEWEQHHDSTPEHTLEPFTGEHEHRPLSMQDLDPIPIPDSEMEKLESQSTTCDLDLPPIPDHPHEPSLPDLQAILDKDARKQAEKEVKRLQKAYTQAVKNRSKAIQEREKLLEKRRNKAAKDADKMAKVAEKERVKQERERARAEAKARESADKVRGQQDEGEGEERPRKLKKFCALPSRREGMSDPTWIDVYMDGMDVVDAHCGLFLSGPHYDKLVGDVGSRIAGWVGDELTKRAILSD